MIADWELLERARRGDETSWRELFQRHHRSLVKIAFLITGSMEAAKDLAQETFVRLLRSKIGHTRGSFKGYLSTIAYRLALKEKRRRLRNGGIDGLEIADGNPSPLEATLRDERQRLVAQAMGTLSDDHRDILILRFYGDHSYDEIAQITNVPMGTVKSRMYYAVKACREKLSEKGVLS
jgi:RNA polymerase sigma-70 factor (ECF subfamily)